MTPQQDIPAIDAERRLLPQIQVGKISGQLNHVVSPVPLVLNVVVPSAGNPPWAIKASQLGTNHRSNRVRIAAEIHRTYQTLFRRVAVAEKGPEGSGDCL